MKRFTILAALAALILFGFTQLASAQAVPSIHGIQEFSPQAKYMSLSGYLRWQYYTENNVWISQEEAVALVRSQAPGSTPVAAIL